ncbi:Protein CBG13806 [Caenorhabditis briggsae]|uniref:Protein CBG13806 n=1 Tax=Caenorhabditis briggsae TaxID=6238 RepID=A8XIR1_CAEBR|nr:Protein CBG13806 [Caenorhabditis briggsae]CAP32536.2 Protein CBG13806 [Caenorhabditis briggsae]
MSQDSQDPSDLQKILAPVFAGFNRTTEAADADGSMSFMHPQGVIVQKDTTSTFGKEALQREVQRRRGLDCGRGKDGARES